MYVPVGGKARPTVLEATFPSIKDDSSHSDQFVYNGTMAEIEIDMEPLEKSTIFYDFIHNDFTHDSYRAQEVAAKNKRVANAVRMGAKLVSIYIHYGLSGKKNIPQTILR